MAHTSPGARITYPGVAWRAERVLGDPCGVPAGTPSRVPRAPAQSAAICENFIAVSIAIRDTWGLVQAQAGRPAVGWLGPSPCTAAALPGLSRTHTTRHKY